jgi:hypothetical protein
MPPSTWRWWLAGCVAVRTAIPLLALALAGKSLPGLPSYVYGPLYGDANGYYAGAREAVSAASRAAPFAAAVVVATVCLLLAARRLRIAAWLVALIAGTGLAAIATVVAAEMHRSGAMVIGWPLLWAIPLAPLRLLDPSFGPDAAFPPGVALSIAANAATCVGVAYVGLRATRSRSVGVVAAVLYTLWPFLAGSVVGGGESGNGMWGIEVGLNLYTEPLSTALVVWAIALLLRRPTTDLALTLAGLMLGFATAVKLTDGVIALVLVATVLLWRGLRPATILGLGGVVFLPLVLLFWHKGYSSYFDGGVSVNPHPFGLEYVTRSWTDSILFTPSLLALLVIPAVIGIVVLQSSFARAVIGLPIAATAVLYSLYDVTYLHPRFFYVVLPLVLALDASATVWIWSKLASTVTALPRSATRWAWHRFGTR